MIVPTEVRPGTTHLIGGPCRCGHQHEHAPPVLKGPAGRSSRIGYVVTDGRLYQQADTVEAEGGTLFEIVRTVGTIERPAA